MTRPNQGFSSLAPGGGKMRDPGNEFDLFKGEGIEVKNGWLNDINSTKNEDWWEFVQNPSVLNPIDEALSMDKTEDVSNNNISNTRVDSQDKVVDSNDEWC